MPNKYVPRMLAICEQCGREFSHSPSKRPKPHKFCSRHCSLAWQGKRTVKMACAYCQTEIMRPAWTIRSQQVFCSRSCASRYRGKSRQADAEPVGRPQKPKPGEQIVYINDESGKRLENR